MGKEIIYFRAPRKRGLEIENPQQFSKNVAVSKQRRKKVCQKWQNEKKGWESQHTGGGPVI